MNSLKFLDFKKCFKKSKIQHYSTSAKPKWIPFHKAKYGNYDFERPRLDNPYKSNAFLQNYLRSQIPQELFAEINSDLTQFGDRVCTEIDKLALECELQKPTLRSTAQAWGDPAGRNELVVCDAWNKQKSIAASEGIISIGYNRKTYGQYARLYQYAKLYLYTASSGMYSCPLAMTDGAAKTLESLNLLTDPMFQLAYNRLTSTNVDEFWTSGQWMTEMGGGSDVGGATETVALNENENLFRLYGYKWFSSATDANMALALARIADQDGNVVQGSKGLSLFYIPVRENGGAVVDEISLIRLKDKMGTRQLPTAELLLDGTLGYKISDTGRGVSAVSQMLQVTRIHNAIRPAAYIQRMYSLSRDYAHRRLAFGRKLIDIPLHTQTLARIDLISKATCIFSLELARLLGLTENGLATEQERLLFRILNPLGKLYNGKIAISTISEGIECIGAQAVMEDTGIPYLYRDAQIFTIWEGTPSVLSLDVLRSIEKSNGETLVAFRSNVRNKLELALEHSNLKNPALKLLFYLEELVKCIQNQPKDLLELCARDISMVLANLFISSLLLENARKSTFELDALLALRFCNQTQHNLMLFLNNFKFNEYSDKTNQINRNIVTENCQ